jgi:signal transduction histidine kinase
VDAALVLIAVSVGLLTVLKLDADPLLGSWLFASILFSLLALSIRAAISAVLAARFQRRRATAIQDQSTNDAAQVALALERRRMSADIVATVRQSLERTTVLTKSLSGVSDARPGLRAIQAEGRAAAVELRCQLGLLRDEDAYPVPAPHTDPSRPHRLRRRDVLLGAGVVAVALFLALFTHDETPSTIQIGLTVTAAATVALWRLNPGLAATINALITAAALATGHPVLSDLWMMVTNGLLIWACVARPVRDRLAVVGPVAMISAAMVNEWLTNLPNVHVMTFVLIVGLVTAVGFRFADASRGRNELVAVSREQELAEAAARAVRADRLRFARELHDTVSGTVGTITMHAAAAEMLWDSDPEAAHDSIGIVHRAIGGALADLDHLMPTLDAARGESDRPVGRPDDGLGGIESLVRRMHDAGVTVQADVDPVGIPPAVARTAFRVVQEALSNCARHAPGALVELRVRRVADELVVEVLDDGPGLRGAQPGYGQVGMRERVAAVGGSVSLQPGDGGLGLLVRATLPLDAVVDPVVR